MKTLLVLIYGCLTIFWGYYFVSLCIGKELDAFTIGASLLFTVLTFLKFTIEEINN